MGVDANPLHESSSWKLCERLYELNEILLLQLWESSAVCFLDRKRDYLEHGTMLQCQLRR